MLPVVGTSLASIFERICTHSCSQLEELLPGPSGSLRGGKSQSLRKKRKEASGVSFSRRVRASGAHTQLPEAIEDKWWGWGGSNSRPKV
jgi:hypothetical protein